MNDIRRENLRRLTETRSPSEIAKRMGWAGPSYVSQLTSTRGIRPITEKTARRLEEALGLDPNWMDREHERVRAEESLTLQAVHVVGRVLQDMNVQIGPRRYAKLVELAVEEAVDGAIDEAVVRRMVDLLKED